MTVGLICIACDILLHGGFDKRPMSDDVYAVARQSIYWDGILAHALDGGDGVRTVSLLDCVAALEFRLIWIRNARTVWRHSW